MVHIGYLLRVEYHDTTPKNSSLTFDTWLLLVIIISHFNLMFLYSLMHFTPMIHHRASCILREPCFTYWYSLTLDISILDDKNQ